MALTKATNRMTSGAEVHVDDFGAKGDGVTDDIIAIDAAVAAVSAAGGGIVRFRKATYMKSTDLVIPTRVKLIGDGMDVTIIKNTAANIDGISFGATASARHGGIEGIQILGNSGDTTNIGLQFHSTNGYAHGVFKDIYLIYFGKGMSSGDQLWECQFNGIRSSYAVDYSFYFVGVAGTSSDNLLTKLYSDKVGNTAGAGTGRGFHIVTALRKSTLLNCTVGDTTSTDTQLYITGSFLNILGGNIEGFTLADTKSAVYVGYNSVVSINGMTVQNVAGPAVGEAYVYHSTATTRLTLTSNMQLNPSVPGNLKSMRVSGIGGKIFHTGNRSDADIAYTSTSAGDSGTEIVEVEGRLFLKAIEIDLSGAATTEMLLYLDNLYGYMKSCNVVYSEATSADAGVAINLGNTTDPTFFGTITNAVSKALWSTEEMTIDDRRITKPVILTCVGGKTGTGKAVVTIEYSIME
jgi:hypothetical protein